MNDQTELTKLLSETVKRLLAEGFTFPLYFSLISPNGNMVCGVFTHLDEHGLVDGETFMEHVPDGITAPINILFVDSTGKAERALFAQGH